MIKVSEIAFIGYPVSDIPRAQAFYEGLLRLRPSLRFDHEGRSWIEYDIGAGTLAISNMAGERWRPSADGPAAALEVEDFDAAVAALRAAKVPFAVEPTDTGVCRMTVVSDPDGNSLLIHHRKPRPA